MERSDPFASIGFDGAVIAGFEGLAELKGGYTPDGSYRDSIPNDPFMQQDQKNADPLFNTLYSLVALTADFILSAAGRLNANSPIRTDDPWANGGMTGTLEDVSGRLGLAAFTGAYADAENALYRTDSTESLDLENAKRTTESPAPSDRIHWSYVSDKDGNLFEVWINTTDGRVYQSPVHIELSEDIEVVAKPDPHSVSPDAHAPYSPGASVDPSGNVSVDTEQTRNRSSAGDRALDETNESNASVQGAIDKGEPIQVPPVDVSQLIRDLNSVFERHETARTIAAGVREAANEAEVRNQEEAALRADLPGPVGAVIPIYGSAKSSRGHFKHGNYGRGVLYGALAISDVFGAKALAVGGGKLVLRGAGALFGSALRNKTVAAALRAPAFGAAGIDFGGGFAKGAEGASVETEIIGESAPGAEARSTLLPKSAPPLAKGPWFVPSEGSLRRFSLDDLRSIDQDIDADTKAGEDIIELGGGKVSSSETLDEALRRLAGTGANHLTGNAANAQIILDYLGPLVRERERVANLVLNPFGSPFVADALRPR